MNKIISTFLMILLLIGCSGCKLLESATSNISGWDISACVSGFDTCLELFTDNVDKFEDGFIEAIDILAPTDSP